MLTERSFIVYESSYLLAGEDSISTSLYVLIPLATTFPEFTDFILQALEVNNTSHSLPHI
jgi:hypothetical protein